MMRRMPYISCALTLLLAAAAAQATTLRRMSLDELTADSGVVARVRCMASESRWEGGRIWTFTTFEVIETLKGRAPSTIRVRLIGGRAGSLTSRVEGVPRFRAGEETFVFLAPAAQGDWTVTGWVLGTFRLTRDKRTGQEAVTQDTAGLTLFDPITRRFEPGGVRQMPLDDFRGRVRRAVSRRGASQ
ncbi:MAG: hypothetical protein ACRD5G_00260 [Candidatus Acidiferrales bacterium]